MSELEDRKKSTPSNLSNDKEVEEMEEDLSDYAETIEEETDAASSRSDSYSEAHMSDVELDTENEEDSDEFSW